MMLRRWTYRAAPLQEQWRPLADGINHDPLRFLTRCGAQRTAIAIESLVHGEVKVYVVRAPGEQ